MQTQHTPGPWYLRYSLGSPTVCVDTPEGPRAIATSHWHEAIEPNVDNPHADEFNARLMAAAPDLLEACKDVIFDLELFVSRQGPGPDRRLDVLKAAIAKAEGR